MKQAIKTANGWLFYEGTRVIQLLSALMYASFAMVLLLDIHEQEHDQQMVTTHLYHIVVNTIPISYVVCAMLFLSVCQFVALSLRSKRSDLIAGCALLWSALGWFLIGLALSATYPPYSMSMVFFPLLGIFCFLAGIYLLHKTNAVINNCKTTRV